MFRLSTTGVRYLTLVCAAVLLAAAMLARTPPARAAHPPAPAVPTVAQSDASCAKCHADIYRRYLDTPMANASGDALHALVPGEFSHAESGVTYKVFERGGRAFLSYDRPAGSANRPAMQGEKELELYVGSGHRGRTYLFQTERWWFEAPINYYTGMHRYDMAPNLLHVKQMPFNFPVDSGCLHCHASSVQLQLPGSQNRYASLPFLQGGITCESCHGDASAHIASEGKAPVLNPAKLTPERRDAVCYRCHLEGETNVEQPGRSPAQYKPGDRLEDYVTYFIHQGAPRGQTRAVSEVEAFSLSGCKRASGDRMTCTTCHDPHGDPAAADRVAFYRGKCLQCHTEAKFASLTVAHAHHPEQPDCTACHMPSLPTGDIAHSQTTDHHIPRHAGADVPAAAPLSARMDNLPEALVPVPGTTASARDAAVATFNLIAEGDEQAAAQARPLLEASNKNSPGDAQVLADLGWLAQQVGERKKAASLFADALQADPGSIPARTDLGVLFAQSRDLSNAASEWRAVYTRNPSIVPLAINLATIDCAAGRRDAAIATLQRLAIFQPDEPTATHLLALITTGGRRCGQAAPVQ